MKRLFRKLRIWCDCMLDRLFPSVYSIPDWYSRVNTLEMQIQQLQDSTFDDLENIKLEQKRQAYAIDNFNTRIQGIKNNVSEIVANLEVQIHRLGGEVGHRHNHNELEMRRIRSDIRHLHGLVANLDRERVAHRKDIADCMKLIKHQHSVMNSFKMSIINPSLN